jgi:hypothetical protein
LEETTRTSFARASARKLLQRCGMIVPPVDLPPILAHLGFEYHLVDFPDGVDALLVTTGDGRRVAGVNRNHHPHRQRFSLAHEIGHRLLGHQVTYYRSDISIDNPPERIDHRREARRLETEANTFAGELLVPLSMLKTAHAKSQDLESLSRIFFVSTQVISIALMNHERSLFK